MIIVENVGKRFKLSRQQKREMGRNKQNSHLDAVSDVTFECKPGRIFSLLGPNGAGKTTALRMVSTMLKPTSGRIIVGGHDTQKNPEQVRRILGFHTGTTKLYDRLTPNELVRYYADLHKMPRAQFKKRRDEIFALLDMEEFSHKRIGKLSTGMKQKVSIARTIIHDPDVLVFDEATSGLDVLASRGIVRLIRNAKDEGKTVLFSTHRMGEVAYLSDDLAIIHKGKLLYNGTHEAFTRDMQSDTLEEEFIKLVEAA